MKLSAIGRLGLAAVTATGLALTCATAASADAGSAGRTVQVGAVTVHLDLDPQAAPQVQAASDGPSSGIAYPIINGNSGKCGEVYHSSTANGAVVDQWTCNGTRTQSWTYLLAGWTDDLYPVYELVNVNSGKCLEVYHSSTANGAGVDQWPCNGTATQLWVYVGGAHVNFNSGKCLEVYHSSTASGAKVDQWTCNGTSTQYWANWTT